MTEPRILLSISRILETNSSFFFEFIPLGEGESPYNAFVGISFNSIVFFVGSSATSHSVGRILVLFAGNSGK